MPLVQILKFEFLGNSVLNWSIALLAFLATFTVLPLLKSYVGSRRSKRVKAGHVLPTAFELVTELIARTGRLFLWIVAVYIGSRFLELNPRAERILSFLVIVISWLQVGIWLVAAVRFTLERRNHRDDGRDAVSSGSLTIVMFVTNLLVWAVVVLLALSNLGVDITALVAGLGIGGIAIALAVQTVLGDLLASLAIAFDKPFRVGDTLGIDDYTGTVEDIGIKSTRLRSVSGEQLIISNADILKSRVRNLGRMPEQRALFTLNVDYETSSELLRRVPALIEEAVKSQPRTRFTYCVLKNFGVTGLEFETIYYVLQPKDYARTLGEVNQQIVLKLAQAGVRFSYAARMALQPLRQPDRAGNGEEQKSMPQPADGVS